MNTTLSAHDRHVHGAINSALNRLHEAHEGTSANPLAGEAATPQIWTYVYEPCTELAIPVECAIVAIQRFFKYRDSHGRYQGSVQGVLRDHGLQALPTKFYLDFTAMIPQVIRPTSPTSAVAMCRSLHAIAGLYFESLLGVDGIISPEDDTNNEWTEDQSILHAIYANGASRSVRSRANTSYSCR